MKKLIKNAIIGGLGIVKLFSKRAYKSLSIAVYSTKKIPWFIGYDEYKKAYLTSVNKHDTQFMGSGYGAGIDERVVEIPFCIEAVKEDRTVLDAGSAFNHQEYLEFLKNKELHIVTLFPEKFRSTSAINYLYADLRDLPYRNDFFDAIICVSTIEHIGFDNTQYLNGFENSTELSKGDYITAVKELKRVLKKNGKLIITAPAGGKAEFEEFQVFDDASIHEMIKSFDPEEHVLDYYKYDRFWKKTTYSEIEDLGYRDNDAAAASGLFILTLIK